MSASTVTPSSNNTAGTHHHYPSGSQHCLLVLSDTRWKSCSTASHHTAVILINSTQVSAAFTPAFYFLWAVALEILLVATTESRNLERPLCWLNYVRIQKVAHALAVPLNTGHRHNILYVPVPCDKINSMYYTVIFIVYFFAVIILKINSCALMPYYTPIIYSMYKILIAIVCCFCSWYTRNQHRLLPTGNAWQSNTNCIQDIIILQTDCHNMLFLQLVYQKNPLSWSLGQEMIQYVQWWMSIKLRNVTANLTSQIDIKM